MSSSSKPRVVILGGGVAALAAAFELTEQPDWRDRFASIEVYQMGWRLGGKGASGRNADLGQRIEEHGLHVWPGFYDNAFQLMRRCYAELSRPPGAPLATWDEAFRPQHFIVVAEQDGGAWKPWGFQAPPNAAQPGDNIDPPQLWDFFLGGLELMANWFHQLANQPPAASFALLRRPQFGLIDWLLGGLESAAAFTHLRGVADWLHGRLLRRLFHSAFAAFAPASDNLLLDAARDLAGLLGSSPQAPSRREQELLLWLADRALAWLTPQLGPLDSLSDTLRRLWIQLDFAQTMLRGAIHDDVFTHGFAALDGETFVAWMRRHGASPITLESALMRGLHAFVFAFENADPARPNLAAGVALQLALRLTLAYKGAVMWKMQAGMGDVVFAPLFEVLSRRGVLFHFFHRVTELKLAADGRSIEEIRLKRQATVLSEPYQPLVDVHGLPCWPNQPRYEQLAEGAALQSQHVNLESVWENWPDVADVTLTAGRDFDCVVLGMSLGALPHTCQQLAQADANWRNMLQQVRTIPTRAAQLWFTPDLAQLGWPQDSPILTAFAGPLETWADMSQTLPREVWPAAAAPRNVAYFCHAAPDDGPLPPPGSNIFLAEQTADTGRDLAAALGSHAHFLFPAASPAGGTGLDWQHLHDPAGNAGIARLNSQFWRANVTPSERYVQSLAGTTGHRLSPDQSGFANLFLAGDWTLNDLNVGCIEAAVLSGRHAARAILSQPPP